MGEKAQEKEMKEPEIGKIYCLIRRTEIKGRNVAVCRRVRVLRVEDGQVLLDRGDGRKGWTTEKEFIKIAEET